MRVLNRNKKKFWYCLFQESQYTTDADGYMTSDKRNIYSEAAYLLANVSPATGYSQTEQFGNLESYDKVIVTDWMDCPIDENTVLFVDKEPEYNTLGDPMYDYVVRRVAKSLNSISIAVSKVRVS